MVPSSLLAENIFSVFRSPHLPLDTPFWTRGFPLVMRSRKAGFPFATRARKWEPCLQRYVSRMTRTENFLSQFFFKVFLHVLWYQPLDTLIKNSSYSWTNQKVQLQLDFLLLIKKSNYSLTNRKVQLQLDFFLLVYKG